MTDEEFLPIFFRNIAELRQRFLKFLEVFGILFLLMVGFRLTYYSIFGVRIVFLKFDFVHNMGAQFLSLLEAHILPSGTKLLILKPTDGVAADFYVVLFLDLLFTMPYLIYQILKYIGPALKRGEKELIRSILVPASVLFASGSIFGIYVVAPDVFKIFNYFDVGLGAFSSVGLLSFTSFLILYTVLFGISFEVPVFMYGLTRSGLVPSEYWRSHWRYSIVVSLIIGMIFSPGVTGFTMIVIAIPMIALYFCGIYFSARWERKSSMKSERVSEAL
ncbi:MAG: twin-arginine translocase subunit TatC [Candidatus Thermoplasmatota archaeon]|nr:twin-arginine translocase subunit TatC [Candidatus Thermoplasmatota archaeon]